jgi:hypothetical protein
MPSSATPAILAGRDGPLERRLVDKGISPYSRGGRWTLSPRVRVRPPLPVSDRRAPGGSSAGPTRKRSVDLLILEDLGARTLAPTAAEDLLEIIARRYETGASILSGNRLTQPSSNSHSPPSARVDTQAPGPGDRISPASTDSVRVWRCLWSCLAGLSPGSPR